jgi:DNA-binding winged helix-turn-helix (wHTH) protein
VRVPASRKLAGAREPGLAYRFGDFTLDPDTRRLLSGAADIHVSPKAFDLLRLLVENRMRAVPKAELQELLWPTTFVEETNLASLVAEIRHALGDTAASPRFVRTVYGFGYQFVGEVAASLPAARTGPPGATLWLVFGRRELPLMEGVNVIGRGADAAIQIDSPGVSRRHARIVVTAGEAILEDLGSKNGTDLNGRRITARCGLCDGDELRLGAMVAVFRIKSPASPTETMPVDPA